MTSFGDISDLGLMCRLHKAVSNPHLVKLFSYFEDPNFVYIVLELCRFFSIPQEYTTRRITRNGNLVELLKRRKAITEPESRYFVHQVGEIIIFFSSGFCAGNTLISEKSTSSV